MYYIFCLVHVLGMAGLITMFLLTLRVNNSHAKTSFMMLMTSMFIIIVSMFIELTMSDSISSALVALKMEYVGLTMLLLSLMSAISYLGSFHIHWILYFFVALLCGVSVITLFLTGTNIGLDYGLFYKSMELVTDGAYSRIECTDGPMWYLFYLVLVAVMVGLVVRVIIATINANSVQRKRVGFILLGLGVVGVELILKAAGVFGSYNPFACALLVMSFCIFMSVFKYGFFNSLAAATENAMNHDDEGILVIDNTGKLIFANAIFRRLMPEALKMKNIMENTTVDAILSGSLTDILFDGVSYEARVEEIREYNVIGGYLIWFINMTEYRKKAKALNDAAEAKSRFLAHMSHEIRTPINAVLGYNELIHEETDDPVIRGYSTDIRIAGDTLLSLINDILDFSRLETGKIELVNAEYSTSQLFNSAWLMISRQAEEKNIALSFNIAQDIPERLFGDSKRLLQVLINLLTNAVKYTDSGSIELTAKVAERSDGQVKLCFSISDTGHGISQENQKKIFDSFVRVEWAGEGTGLGLAITRQCVELMGGDITLSSSPGAGSTFYITLKQSISSEKVIGEFTPMAVESDAHDSVSVRLTGKRVLVVDDNNMNSFIASKFIQRLEAVPECADSGEQALELMREKRYDIILLDIMMPGMDGVETMSAMQSDGECLCGGVPVIAVTSDAITGARERYLHCGFSDYLSKPISPQDLEMVLAKYLGGKPDTAAVQSVPDSGLECPKSKLCPTVLDKALGLQYSADDAELYAEMTSLFIHELPEKRERLSDALSRGDRRLYKTLVHALKNNARSIGGMAAGEIAYTLEQCAEHGSEDELQALHKRLMSQLDELADALGAMAEMV